MIGEALLPLSREEQKLLLALREIPPSRLRDLMTTLVVELADFVSAPTCSEMQADGAPCPTTPPTTKHRSSGARRPAVEKGCSPPVPCRPSS